MPSVLARSTRYVLRAAASSLPLITLLGLNMQGRQSVSATLAFSLLASQVIFRLVNYGWSVSVLSDRNIGRQRLNVNALFLASVATIGLTTIAQPQAPEWVSLGAGLTICTILTLYLELASRSRSKLFLAAIYLSKPHTLILFLPGVDLVVAFAICASLYVVLFNRLRDPPDRVSRFNSSARRRFWLNGNINYAVQNYDQILMALVFPSLFQQYAIATRVIRIFDPLLFAYNELTALKYAREENTYSLRAIRKSQLRINAIAPLLSFGGFFILTQVPIMRLEFFSFYIFTAAGYLALRLTSGAHYLLNYNDMAGALLKYEFFTMLSLMLFGVSAAHFSAPPDIFFVGAAVILTLRLAVIEWRVRCFFL